MKLREKYDLWKALKDDKSIAIFVTPNQDHSWYWRTYSYHGATYSGIEERKRQAIWAARRAAVDNLLR